MSQPVNEAVLGLVDYLETNVTDFANVYDEWPNAQDELIVPSCSVITMGRVSHDIYMAQTILSQVQDPDNNNNLLYTYEIGQFEFSVQVDVWTEYKPQREVLNQKVIDAINKQFLEQNLPTGLSLTLASYHNTIARYDYVGYTYMDSEENSQKKQWRSKIELMVTVPEVKVVSIPRMKTVELRLQEASTTFVGES